MVKLKSTVRQKKSRIATALIVVQRGEWIIAAAVKWDTY